MKRFLKFLIPALMFVGAGAFVVFVQLYLVNKVNTVPVIVAKQNIEFKGVINQNTVAVKDVNKKDVVKGAYNAQDLKTLLGKNAAIDIKKGAQIYPEMVDSYNLIPNEKKGEFIAPIPKDWLFAVPGSLRRTYIADFYVIPDKSQQMIRNMVQSSQNNNNSQKQDSSSTKKDSTNNTQPITGTQTTDSVVKGITTPVLSNVRVSSVKDSSNQEVTTDKKKGGISTGTITSIEIITTQDKLDKLKKFMNQGYKIYVVYKFNRR